MSPLEENVLAVRKMIHSEDACKNGMLHFDFYNKLEMSASFATTFFLDLYSIDERTMKLNKDSFVVGYAPAGITPCKTRLLSHVFGVYMSNLLERADFDAKRVYLSGIFCLGPGRDGRNYVHKYNLDSIVESDIEKLFIPAKKRELVRVTASDF
jgi:hypothetical protein